MLIPKNGTLRSMASDQARARPQGHALVGGEVGRAASSSIAAGDGFPHRQSLESKSHSDMLYSHQCKSKPRVTKTQLKQVRVCGDPLLPHSSFISALGLGLGPRR